jgi:maltooligosyltrehalose trehalohydrolase
MSKSSFFGAKPTAAGTHFRLWAPEKSRAAVDVEGAGSFALTPEEKGYFSALVPNVGVGAKYKFRLDDGLHMPDLGSRWQPEGSDGVSVVVSPDYAWTDAGWAGPVAQDQVIYELHVGTFTSEGTWNAAREKLRHLKDLGVTVIQVMPVGCFKGTFGWGYDTTLPYAPYAPYGTPDYLRGFVDAAHGLGIGVILDVVYNHAGMGDYYHAYSEHFFTHTHENEWGSGFNYDGENSRAVRDFMIGNAVYWIEDFHLDGLRIDAAQAMFDTSETHIIAELTDAVREAAKPRRAYMVVENQPQERRMIADPKEGGFGLDGMYSDDFQHAIRVAATGHNDFYYRDYLGSPQEIVSALKYGFLYQGQRSDMRDKAYGTYNLETPAEHFVHFLENHDQVANSAKGLRLSELMSPARLRAITPLLLLGPQTPCLFQGQEFGSRKPFLYFAGRTGEEAEAVAEGRKKGLMDFPSVTDPEMQATLARPDAPKTFELSKLDWLEMSSNSGILALHKDLLALRRTDAAFSQNSVRRVDGAVIGEGAFVLRFFMADPSQHRLLLCNLGRDLHMAVTPEPLLAPPDGQRWALQWSSEHPKYGGAGRRPVEPEKFWILPSDCTLVLKPSADYGSQSFG